MGATGPKLPLTLHPVFAGESHLTRFRLAPTSWRSGDEINKAWTVGLSGFDIRTVMPARASIIRGAFRGAREAERKGRNAAVMCRS